MSHSHKIRTGILGKKTWKDADLFKMFHELTPPQMSFFRECVVQELGGKKSAFWGHQRIPFKITHNCSKKDLLFFMEALNHPTHIFARKMSLNKNAAGFGASAGRAIIKAGKLVGKYAVKGAKWMAAHAKQIMGGLDTAIGLGVTGVNIAYQMGALDDESDATLLGLTNIVGMAHQLYHQGDEDEAKKTEVAEKTGEGFYPKGIKKTQIAYMKQHPEIQNYKHTKLLPKNLRPAFKKGYDAQKQSVEDANKPKWLQRFQRDQERSERHRQERQIIQKLQASHRGKNQIKKKSIT